jgi:hypothetical protein
VSLPCGALRPISDPGARQIFDRWFVNGIIRLGEVERLILFIHAGRKRKFAVNSLFPGHNLHIWAEFGDFWMEFDKFPVNFAVLVTTMEMQVEIGLFHSKCRQRDTPTVERCKFTALALPLADIHIPKGL